MSDPWLIQTYYEESSCSTYAGEGGSHNYVCIPQESGLYAKTSYTLTNDVYTITVSHYTDINCQFQTGGNSVSTYTAGCQTVGNHYIKTSTALYPNTDFPEDGALSRYCTQY
jgi:hypothetical protein